MGNSAMHKDEAGDRHGGAGVPLLGGGQVCDGPPTLNPAACKVDGLAFVGLSLSVQNQEVLLYTHIYDTHKT